MKTKLIATGTIMAPASALMTGVPVGTAEMLCETECLWADLDHNASGSWACVDLVGCDAQTATAACLDYSESRAEDYEMTEAYAQCGPGRGDGDAHANWGEMHVSIKVSAQTNAGAWSNWNTSWAWAVADNAITGLHRCASSRGPLLSRPR